MGCRSVLKSAILIEAWRPVNLTRTSVCASFKTRPGLLSSSSSPRLYSSHNDNHPGHSDDEQAPPQEAVLKAISEVSRTEGRVGQTTNVVIGGTVADDSTTEWLDLDQKLNSYPTVRGFTAIGTGGDDFVQAMVVAVESVLELSVPQDHVKQKLSSGGKYVSVNIGPVQVVSSEQLLPALAHCRQCYSVVFMMARNVQAVYNAMRRDNRMKYFL